MNVGEESLGAASQGEENIRESNLGKLSQDRISDFIKAGFLDEGEAKAPEMEQVDDSDEAESNDSVEDADESPKSDESEDDSLPKGFQKRINKLVGQKKALEAELEAQKAELLNLRKSAEASKQLEASRKSELSDGVQNLETLEQVESEFEKTINLILWCEENPDGGVINTPNGEEEISMEVARQLKKAAIRRKEIELPARYKMLSNQQAIESEIVKDFPWWNKPETEEYRVAQQILQEFPELKRRRVDYKRIAGLVVLGAKAYEANRAGKGATKAQPVIRKAPSQPSIKAPVSSSGGNSVQKAKEFFVKNPSDKSGLSDMIKQMGFI